VRVTHVLFPYHASRRGDRALRAAADLADRSGAKLTVLVPVIDTEGGRRCCGIQGQKWLSLLREVAANDLERAQAHLGTRSVGTRYEIAEGASFHKLLETYARAEGCDLTVVSLSVLGALVRRRDLHQLETSSSTRGAAGPESPV